MKAQTLELESIDPKDLKREMEKLSGCLLLDVRTPAEFKGGHIPGAKNIPLGDLNPESFLKKEGQDCQRLFVICQSGGRARKAAEQFEKAGFTGCALVEGGMDAWVQDGLPVERIRATGIPILRQVQITVGIIVAIGSVLTLTIDALFAWIPLFMGCGLIFAGATGFCGLALILARMPWNRMPACSKSSCCS